MKLLKTILAYLFVTLLFSCTASKKQEAVIFKDVNIIHMVDESIITGKSLYIKNGKIEKIDIFENITQEDNPIVIDCKDKYIMPGLSDMHVHTYNKSDLNLFLANGVTLVRNMWGLKYHINLKSKINKGRILGPEMFTAGPITDGQKSMWNNTYRISELSEVEDYMKFIKNEGYDYIKVYDNLSKDIFNKISTEARKEGIPVVGHVPKAVNINDAIKSEMRTIEHFMGYNLKFKRVKDLEETINLTIENDVWNCPTLVLMSNYHKMIKKYVKPEALTIDFIPELKYVSNTKLEEWSNSPFFDMQMDKSMNFVKELNNRGAKIVSGTDMGSPYNVAGFSLHEELELLNKSGLTPYEVLKTTTINPAVMLGINDRAGTIEIGKDADLVLLDNNPLDNIKNTRSISGVMVKGRWLTSTKLNSMLKKVEK